MIENLAVTRDAFETIDLSDNDLRKVDNLPTLKRLGTLLLSNNQITRLEIPSEKLPNLQMLILNNNRIEDVSQIIGGSTSPTPIPVSGLKGLNKLRYLSLIDCPVTRTPHFRLAIIHHLPQLKVLDFRKITMGERKAAAKMFKSKKRPAVAFPESAVAPEDEEEVATLTGKRGKLSDEDRKRIEDALAKASTLEEIRHLERILETGHIPDF